MFRGLQFSLTWRYTLVTVVTLFTVELVALLIFQIATAGNTLLPTPDTRTLETIREKILTTTEPQSWLDNLSPSSRTSSDATGSYSNNFYLCFARSPGTLYLLDT